MKCQKITAFVLLLILQIAFVFATPVIESFTVKPTYPSHIQMDWKISDEEGLARLELYMDKERIYKEMLTGTKETSLYQIEEDNETHKFTLIVYNVVNRSTTAVKERAFDKTIPEIKSSLKQFSNQKTLTFQTNEKAYCKAGLSSKNLTDINKNYEINHSVSLSFIEGVNKAYVFCVDENNNEMSKVVVIDFTYDTTKPGKVSELSYEKEGNQVKISWLAATDSSGIEKYNIYSAIQLLATTKETNWITTTNDSAYYITAIDKAGNEGEKQEYAFRRDLLLSSSFKAENKTSEENKEAVTITLNTTTASIIAWSVFGTLLIVFIAWKIYEHKTDKHGLRSYLRKRRKMRDIEVYKKHD